MKFKQISTKFLSCATSIAVFTSGLLLNNLNIKAAARQSVLKDQPYAAFCALDKIRNLGFRNILVRSLEPVTPRRHDYSVLQPPVSNIRLFKDLFRHSHMYSLHSSQSRASNFSGLC